MYLVDKPVPSHIHIIPCDDFTSQVHMNDYLECSTYIVLQVRWCSGQQYLPTRLVVTVLASEM